VIFTASKTPQHVVKITTYAFLSDPTTTACGRHCDYDLARQLVSE